MSAATGNTFNLREIRESLALAEQLAKASMTKSDHTPCASADANNNNEEMPRASSYVPPKQLLLYLVRMGSFTSAPKIVNDDHQDDDVDFSGVGSRQDLLQLCDKELNGLPALIKRQFVPIKTTATGVGADGAATLRLFQWNLLSQSLGEHNDNFISCPPEALQWSTRRYRLLEEIVEYSPDVICLQEVDHYQFLLKALRTQGFEGTYFPKPDSPCIYIKGNNGPDGCAIFYRTSAFELVRVETRVVEVWRVQSNQVVILVILKHKATGREFCVATTHLKARQGALLSTLRNEQGKDILDFLHEHVDDRPLIVCGDFNAEPSEPVYSTILSDERFDFHSAYRTLDGQEPAYTTWKIRGEGETCHTIDYVFFSRNRFNVQQLLAFPTGHQVGPNRVPSFQYPSDHFSLVVDFQLTPSASQPPVPSANPATAAISSNLLCI